MRELPQSSSFRSDAGNREEGAQVKLHYRNDNPKGITAPNLDAERSKVAHITKHRGMKTPYTSVSEDKDCIQHFGGVTYQTDPQDIISHNHVFVSHPDLLGELQELVRTS
jgi:hypothetical protein